MEPNWNLLKKELEFDGTLPDIWVSGTTLEDVKKFFEYLKTSSFEITVSDSTDESVWKEFDIGGYYSSISADQPLEIFHLDNNGVTINWFLMSEKSVDFDIDPRQITDADKLGVVLQFMKELSALLKKEVVLSPEGGPDHPILVCDPVRNELRYIPA